MRVQWAFGLSAGFGLFLGVSLALLSGCGADTSSPVEADAGVVPSDAGTPDAGPGPCTLTPQNRHFELSEGGRILIDAPTSEGAIAPVEIAAPEGWRVTARAEGGFAVRLPYAVQGEFELQLSASCAERRVTEALSVRVRAIEFSALPAWAPTTEGPDAREHTLMYIDPAEPDQLFLYGGLSFEPRQYTLVSDLWRYDLVREVWTRSDGPGAPLRSGGRAAGLANSAGLMFAFGSDASLTSQLAIDRLDLSSEPPSWSAMPLQAGPGVLSSELGALIYDRPRDRYISACGIEGQTIHCQVSSFSAATSALTVLQTNHPDGEPDPRYGFFYAHDEENQRLVLWSGARIPSFRDPVRPATDAWALELAEEPPRWVKLLDSAPDVPGRRNGCAGYDAEGHRLLIWGGTPDARTTSTGLYALDLDRGQEAFTRIDIAPPHDERSSCTGVADPARHRILFGFGNNNHAIYNDLVALGL